MKVNTAKRQARADHLSTAGAKALHKGALIGNSLFMGQSRVDKAMARIETAIARLEAARNLQGQAGGTDQREDAGSSARVMELVNRHEQLKEEVADTLRDLDILIGEMEG